MDNSEYSHLSPVDESLYSGFGESQFEQDNEQNQQAFFAGMLADVHALEPSQKSTLPVAFQQMPEQRPLSVRSVSGHIDAPYLSAMDEPGESLLRALYSDQTTTFEDDLPPLFTGVGFLDDINELVKREQKVAYAPVRSTPYAPEPGTRTITSIPKEAIDSSIEAHFQRALSGIVVEPKKSSHSNTDAVIPRLKGKKLTAPLSKSGKVLSAPPPAIAEESPQLLSGQSLGHREQAPPTNEWVIKTGDEEKRYKCGFPGCGTLHARRAHLRRHFFIHTGISDYKCPYKKCGRRKFFRDSSELKRHVREIHTKKRPYHCDFCSRRFTRKDCSKTHMKKWHSEQLNKPPSE